VLSYRLVKRLRKSSKECNHRQPATPEREREVSGDETSVGGVKLLVYEALSYSRSRVTRPLWEVSGDGAVTRVYSR